MDSPELELTDARKAFLEERQTGIGSTMSPVILGLARYGTPFSLWEELTGRAAEKQQTLPMWLGLKMQNVVGELYAHQQGKRLRADNRMHRHPHHPWLYTHLDFRVIGERRLVECKTSSRWDQFGPDGSEDIPVDYWVQVQHEMAVTGYPWCDLAVLLSNREFRHYPIPRNDTFIAGMIEADHEFWFGNVQADVPPYDGSEAAEHYLRSQKQQPTMDLKVATSEVSLLVDRYLQLGDGIRLSIEEKNKLRQQLELAIGEAEGLYGPGWTVTFKQNNPSTTTEWSLVATSLAALLRQVADAASIRHVRQLLATNDPETITGLYTQTKPGDWVLRVNKKKQRN